jgi:hypothetical protein
MATRAYTKLNAVKAGQCRLKRNFNRLPLQLSLAAKYINS